MKFFTNQSIWRKIVIVLLIVLLFNVVLIKPVHADTVEFGGKLMSPILSLFVSFSDGIMDVIGKSIMGSTSTLYEIEMGSTFWETLGTILVAIVAAVIVIVAIVATMGAAAVALAAVGITATVTVGMGTIIAGLSGAILAGVWFNDQVLPDNLYLPLYTYSAEEIFKGNILLFDVNFFDEAPTIKENKNSQGEIQYYYYLDDDGKEVKTSNQNSAVMLTKTVSTWYNALKNICLVLMLSILVYIGIRILLSSVASDKAKYLTMLKDWFIGLCLLFLMHYIMAFSVTLVEKLTDVVKTSVDENGYVVVMEANKKMKEAVDEDHLNQPDVIQTGADGKDYLNWPTNLMGNLRLQLQMEQYGATYIGLCICFIMLCLFTLYFTITYLKRVLHMAFLTLIAPLVALTYCIDKLNDGQAQGFNKWFKEYIFNLLIQPMHLLLYYILVTSAFELASTNVIYSIVAIGFMIPAEKLLRSLFGFEKAQTAPAMGPAGAMMASSMLTNLLHKGPKGNGNGKDENKENNSSDRVPTLRDPDPIGAFANHEQSNQDSENQNDDTQAINNNQLDDNGQAWQDFIDNGQDDDSNNPPINNNELDDNGQAWQDFIDNGQDDDSNNPPINNNELDDNGQAWQDFIDNGQDDDSNNPPINNNELDDNGQDDDSNNPPRQVNENQNNNEEQVSENEQTEPAGKSPRRNKSTAGRRIKRMAHASWAAQKATMRNVPQKFKRKLENSHPIRMAGRMATGAAVGAVAGAVGLAIGATTGDLSNVAKIGGGATAAGFALGSGRANNIKSPMQDATIQEVRNDAYNKGEYKPDALDDYVKDFRTDVKNRNYFEQVFGKDEAKKMLRKGGEVEQYLENGITDKSEMKAMHKLQKEKIVNNVDEAIAISQLGSMIGTDTNNMTSKKRGEWATRLSDMAGESGVRDKEAFAKKRLKELDKFYDFKNK